MTSKAPPRAQRAVCATLAALGLLCGSALPASAQTLEAPVLVRKKPHEVELTWGSVPSTTEYMVYRKLGPNDEWRPLKQVKETRYVDQALLPRSIAYYKVVGGEFTTAPAGPIEALDDFYVELQYVSGKVARLYYHQYRPLRSEWTRSLAIQAPLGENLSGTDVVGDFETQVKLLKVGKNPASAKVAPDADFVKLLTEDHRLLEVTVLDKVPLEVYDPEPKPEASETSTTGETKTRTTGPDPTLKRNQKPLKFPQPKLVSQLPGSRLEWEIVNQSKFKMHFVIKGKHSHNFKVAPDTTHLVRFNQGGDYKVEINAIDDDVVPMEGEFGLLQGNRYQSVFGVKVLDEDDPRVKNPPKKP